MRNPFLHLGRVDRYIAWPGQALSYYMGELAIARAREKAEKTLGVNGPDGISNIEGKVARVATSKLGNERVSNSTSALSTTLCSSLARYRCPLSPRGSTASSLKTAKALTRTWSEQAAVATALWAVLPWSAVAGRAEAGFPRSPSAPWP
jgi:hypothetical protein